MTPRGNHNGSNTSLPTAGSFPEPAAARLPPTSEGALASEASWGQLSAQGHGWISLSLCETTVVGSSSTKNWGKKNNPPLPAIWRASRHKPKYVCHMYTAAERGDAAVGPSARHAACQLLTLGWAAESGRASCREAWLPLPPPPPSRAWMGSLWCGCGGPDPASIGVFSHACQ